jgi:hypothetical protein
MKIYFGHPTGTYNTEYETLCLEKIKELYPGEGIEIVNPRDIKIAEEDKNPRGYAAYIKQMDKYYIPELDKCDLLMVAKTKKGKISPGVQKEIAHMIIKGKKVEYLDVQFPEVNRKTILCYWCKKQILEEDALFCGPDESGDGRTYGCANCAGV